VSLVTGLCDEGRNQGHWLSGSRETTAGDSASGDSASGDSGELGRYLPGRNLVAEIVGVEAIKPLAAGFRLGIHEEAHGLAG